MIGKDAKRMYRGMHEIASQRAKSMLCIQIFGMESLLFGPEKVWKVWQKVRKTRAIRVEDRIESK